jgi:hypothetical protein
MDFGKMRVVNSICLEKSWYKLSTQLLRTNEIIINMQVNWEQNVAGCCKLGMTPITFETAAKANCFKQFIDGKIFAS